MPGRRCRSFPAQNSPSCRGSTWPSSTATACSIAGRPPRPTSKRSSASRRRPCTAWWLNWSDAASFVGRPGNHAASNCASQPRKFLGCCLNRSSPLCRGTSGVRRLPATASVSSGRQPAPRRHGYVPRRSARSSKAATSRSRSTCVTSLRRMRSSIAACSYSA